MNNRWWNILVVDDEPDIHSVTRLALRRLQVYGLPLTIHSARSKAEAIDWLNTNPEAKALHAALVDVVMESDSAGLELCRYIREEHKDVLARIILRTGQAGSAPEREIVDNYDISLYLAKTDATENKLYSTVKCCIKDWYSSSVLARMSASFDFVAPYTSSLDGFKTRVGEALRKLAEDSVGRRVPSLQPNYAFLWGEEDDHVGCGIFEDRKTTIEVRDWLLKQHPLLPIRDTGDSFTNGPDPLSQAEQPPLNTTIFVLEPSPDGWLPRQYALFCTPAWPIPGFYVDQLYTTYLTTRPLYKLAKLASTQTGG